MCTRFDYHWYNHTRVLSDLTNSVLVTNVLKEAHVFFACIKYCYYMSSTITSDAIYVRRIFFNRSSGVAPSVL